MFSLFLLMVRAVIFVRGYADLGSSLEERGPELDHDQLARIYRETQDVPSLLPALALSPPSTASPQVESCWP